MDVLMPQLGETVAEGKITKWFKAAGEAVKPGDNLFEIETDKVAMEVPSTTAGVLAEIRVPAGAHGRIVARDVEAARASGKQAAPAAAPFAGLIADQVKALYRDVPFEEVPLDSMRKVIAERLTQAKQTIPHFYLTADVDIG